MRPSSLEAAGLLTAAKNTTEPVTRNTNRISELLAGIHICDYVKLNFTPCINICSFTAIVASFEESHMEHPWHPRFLHGLRSEDAFLQTGMAWFGSKESGPTRGTKTKHTLRK